MLSLSEVSALKVKMIEDKADLKANIRELHLEGNKLRKQFSWTRIIFFHFNFTEESKFQFLTLH